MYTDIQLYGGYPMILIDAHRYSSFLGLDAMSIVADLAVRFGYKIQPEPSMEVLFQPFNAFAK
jgi:hypothetical protein